MGSKPIVLALAGVALSALAFVALTERDSSSRAAPETSREPALLTAQTDAPLTGALAPAGAAREPATRATASERVELAGFVHALDGWPLAGAQVVWARDEPAAEALVARGLPDERWTTTDEHGRFHLSPGRSPEDAGLWVIHAGFFSGQVELARPAVASAEVDVLLHARPVLEIELVPPPGSVFASDAPTEATVWVRNEDGEEETVTASADAVGRLVARDLPLGRVERVRARVRGFGRVEHALDLALEPDGRQRIELELPLGAELSGIVLDAHTEQPISGAQVWAEGAWLAGGSSPVGQSDEHGRFALAGVELQRFEGVANLSWCLVSAQADGYVARRAELRSWPTSATQRYWAELRLQPADVRVEGRVLLPGGAPARATVFSVDARGGLVLAQTDERGTFALEGLSAGTLELLFQPLDGERAALRTALELHEGETRVEEFRLEPARAVVRGRLRDARGAPLAGVELRLDAHMVAPTLAFVSESRTATSDAAGRFEFTACPPGQHFLEITSVPGGLLSEPGPGNFELAADETRSFEFTCAAPIELGGHVELAGRDPATLRVVAFTTEGGANLAESVVAADGTFRFARLYPARIELVLLAGDKELARAQTGPESALDLRLTTSE